MSPVFIVFPFMEIKTMSPPTQQQDLFDLAAEGRAANNHAYIDQVDSGTDEEEKLLSNSDDDPLFDQLDDLRVEDEDWEFAERGSSFLFFPLWTSVSHFFIIPCRLY